LIIDFHTHVFPDELAPRAMQSLSQGIAKTYQPVSDGTKAGLMKKMDDWGIDISVILPVVTKASQVKKANEFVASISSERLICFGGIYPHTTDFREDINFVKRLGLRGLKFHAEYQNFVVDDPHMLAVYDYALSQGLIVLHHAGYDPAFPPPFKSTPKQFANIARAMRGGIIVAAHLGGHDQWDDVEEHLAGCDIFLDTSMGFEYFNRNQFLRIVKKHGPGKILFGSDAPWSNASSEIRALQQMQLDPLEIEAILGGNASRILGLAGNTKGS